MKPMREKNDNNWRWACWDTSSKRHDDRSRHDSRHFSPCMHGHDDSSSLFLDHIQSLAIFTLLQSESIRPTHFPYVKNSYSSQLWRALSGFLSFWQINIVVVVVVAHSHEQIWKIESQHWAMCDIIWTIANLNARQFHVTISLPWRRISSQVSISLNYTVSLWQLIRSH